MGREAQLNPAHLYQLINNVLAFLGLSCGCGCCVQPMRWFGAALGCFAKALLEKIFDQRSSAVYRNVTRHPNMRNTTLSTTSLQSPLAGPPRGRKKQSMYGIDQGRSVVVQELTPSQSVVGWWWFELVIIIVCVEELGSERHRGED